MDKYKLVVGYGDGKIRYSLTYNREKVTFNPPSDIAEFIDAVGTSCRKMLVNHQNINQLELTISGEDLE